MQRFNSYLYISLLETCLLLLALTFSFNAQAANGPTVNELEATLNSTWNTLLKITYCDRTPPQDEICMQQHNGKTITVRLFGQPVNALILFETSSRTNVSGPVVTQQTGFLIGPFNDYAYKVVNELQAHGYYKERRLTDNGLKVYAHNVNGQNISSDGIELNKGENWLDGKHEPWIHHWSSLAKTQEVLKKVKRYLESND